MWPSYLASAIARARQSAHPEIPTGLADAIEAACTGDRDDSIWSAFDREYQFLRVLHVAGRQPRPEETQKFVNLLAWIIYQLATWSGGSDYEIKRLRALLYVTHATDLDAAFWSVAPDALGANETLMAALASYIATFRVELDAEFGRNPIYNKEAVRTFNEADSAGNWAKLGELYPWLDLGFVDVPLEQAARCLARFHFEYLVKATRTVQQTPVAATIARALGRDNALQLAVRSASLHQKFSSVFESLHSLGEPLALRAQQSLTEVLIQISADVPIWRAWMEVFNTYPVRFPALQAPLGVALASMQPSGVAAYVESIELYPPPHQERDLVAECLRTFRSIASSEARATLWTIAYQRWTAWDFDSNNKDRFLFEVSGSALDYAVVGYIVECMDPADRTRQLNAIIGRAKAVDAEWYSALSHCISAFNRLLSRLQPFAHAQNIAETGGDWISRTAYTVEFGSSADAYYRAKFGR